MGIGVGLLVALGVAILVSSFGGAMFYLHLRRMSSLCPSHAERPKRTALRYRLVWLSLAVVALLVGLKLVGLY